jgi:hypothetical protein
MPEQTDKAEKALKEEKAVTLSVRLALVGISDQPVSANHTTVGVAPGIAYLDFGYCRACMS